MKTLILVLGMHRSGTSMVTGILNNLGLEIGDNLMPPTIDNPKGYFENMDFYDVHEHFLLKYGLFWNNVKDLKNKNLVCEENIQLLMRTIMKYRQHEVFAVKDPRLCVLLPLYEQVCKELRIELNYIYVERDRDSVINSIHKRDNLPKSRVAELIDTYLEEVLKRKFILKLKYEEVLIDVEKSIDEMIKVLPFLKKENKIKHINEFVDIKLKRN